MFARASLAAVALALGGCSRPSAGSGGAERPAEASVVVNPDFQGPLVDGLARADIHGVWGFVNERDELVIAPRFDWVESFSGGRAAVQREGRWGFVDRTGMVVIDVDLLDADPFSEGLAAVRKKDGWRYVDDRGQVVIAGPFLSARPFACGQARVQVAMEFLVGDGAHGTFELVMKRDLMFRGAYDGDNGSELRARAVVLGLEPGRTTSPGKPVTRPGGHVDEVALTTLYDTVASAGLMNGDWATVDGLKIEPQWDEKAWVVIDRTGSIVPPALVKPCDADSQGGRVQPPAPGPEDLAATIARLHTHHDRSPVFRQFYELGPPAVPALVKALESKSERVRLNALEILARMGPQAAEAVPAIAARLHSAEVFYAAWALGRMGPAAAPAVPALLEVRARRPSLVDAAVLDIGADASPALLAAAARAAPPLDGQLVLLLGALGATQDPGVLPALERALRDARPDLAASGALALRRLGSKAGDAGAIAGFDAALLGGLRDPRFGPKLEALAAIDAKALEDPAPRASLLELARTSPDHELRMAAGLSLAGARDPAVAPVLVALFGSEDENAALRALERLGPVAAPVAGAAVKGRFAATAAPDGEPSIFDDDTPRCRTHDLAALALVAFGGSDEAVLGDVRAQLSPDPPDPASSRFMTRHCDSGALRVLLELGARGKKAVPWLLDYLERTSGSLREGGLVLKAIGPEVIAPLVDRARKPKASTSLKTLLLDVATRFPAESAAALPIASEIVESDASAELRQAATDALAVILRARPAGEEE